MDENKEMQMEKQTDETIYRTMFAEYPDIVGAEQLCEMLDLKYKTVCKFVREGKIPRMPDGRKIRVAKIEVINYVLQRAQKQP
ncbi:MAG: helix-turn-helix domain-containing protein [Alistipes sp.]|nr:helix-turn-helix domain-containing protein [Alistipes sp.]